MAYIFRDVELNANLEIRNSLMKIFGIGKNRANFVSDSLGLHNSVQLKTLNYYTFFKIAFLLKTYYNTELNLKQKLQMDLQLLLETETSYRCVRYKLYLPLRGQRTRTNAQT
jgi:ribosomal protein S13